MAIESPTFTTKELEEGRESLEPTVQAIEVAEEAVTAQGIPSMVTVGVSKFRDVPVRVIE